MSWKMELLCPSAQADLPGAIVFAARNNVNDEKECLRYFPKPVAVTEELISIGPPQIISQVVRIAAICQQSACKHYDSRKCRLVTTVVNVLTETNSIPRCSIRSFCLWWHQEGKEACARCPHIVTTVINPNPSEEALINASACKGATHP